MGSPHVTLCAATALLAAVLGPQGAALAASTSASAAPERPLVRAETCLTRPATPDAGPAPTPYPSRSCPPRDTNGPRPPRAARQAHAPEPAGHGGTGTAGRDATVATGRDASDSAGHDATERAATVPVARAAGPSAAQAVVGLLLAATAALVVAFGVLRRGRR
ncbi:MULTISPECIES: hypothetical protein [unclassified Streptomyces]|uniref:hypothetical protein n=1 Tax=unclassified Streptomyces TaxID=2593676 RepID=UPI00081D8A55|nr:MULTISPECIES: hypothetical protein [unclassified Streptomyces]MYR27635.1 hypothetical protein [Streptomyces sp. SID4945]SCF26697.1 hypothetical protein GA0115257_10935 [Streptomyces sp. LcepLS]